MFWLLTVPARETNTNWQFSFRQEGEGKKANFENKCLIYHLSDRLNLNFFKLIYLIKFWDILYSSMRKLK